jgi:hypothetical protein
MNNEKQNIDFKKILNQPAIKITIAITVIIIIVMYLTSSLWLNLGVGLIYKEYKAEYVFTTNNIPDGVFILSGDYNYISEWVDTSNLYCENKKDVKLLAYTVNELGNIKKIIVMDVINGCNK